MTKTIGLKQRVARQGEAIADLKIRVRVLESQLVRLQRRVVYSE